MPWKKHRQIPDVQVRDAADQFKRAWDLLDNKPPGSGVVLSQINAAAVAIELYLKCLSSEVVYTPDKLLPQVSVLTAKPEQWGHDLITILGKIPIEHQRAIETFYATRNSTDKRTFRDVLAALNGAFMASRYPFEKDSDITKYKLSDLGSICAILHDYVANLEVKETFIW